MNKNITIAGLGWLGQAFANYLKIRGFQVKGSVTTAVKAGELARKGIPAHTLLLSENGVSGEIQTLLSHTDILAIMIPPGLRRNTGANYALRMAHFLHHIEESDIKKVILVSSTSVYDDSQGKVTEKDVPLPQTNAAKQLYDVEQIFFNAPSFETSIVRFGGLFGGSRNPVRFLTGRKDLRNGEAPVNLIHREDCLGILYAIIVQDAFGHIFNAVAPQHPSKKNYYKMQAKALGLEPPTYLDEAADAFKQVDSIHLEKVLNYTFKRSLE